MILRFFRDSPVKPANDGEEGQEEGKQQQALEVARRMLAEKFDLDTIVRISGLTEEQVRAL